MSLLRFDGRVVVITGAGRGLGREYALEFARRGAKVVVNDLGGSMDGGGKGVNKAADDVVSEIKSNGGLAIANYDSVENGERIVKTAVDNFGRVDVLVNNAGILRDRSFQKMNDVDWDLVLKVHLSGAFKVTKAAWPYFKQQKYGRIIMTSSGAGVYGNFGQANYSAAKLGLLGLSNTLAIEGQRHNIFCNTVAPVAASRLTENVMPKEVLDSLHPKYIAPVVVYLCHESCDENGSIFETAAGWTSRLRWQATKGVQFRKWEDSFTADTVRDHWSELSDWDAGIPRGALQETVMEVTSSIKDLPKTNEQGTKSSESSNQINPSKTIGYNFEGQDFSYTQKDAILYALGIGTKVNEASLKYLYEGHESFSILPTFAIMFAQNSIFDRFTIGIPGLECVSPTQILHGEQYLEVFAPIPAQGVMKNKGIVTDVVDKGKGALLLIDADTTDLDGKLICKNQFSIFLNGAGGFGGKRKTDKAIPLGTRPNRAPDKIIEEKTSPDQAALYRLNGDLNPLHIDAGFASVAGFQKPILHGLCSYGLAVRHVLEAFAGNDVSLFKCVKARFNRPVLPGQTLATEMWKENNRVHFLVKVKETGESALTGGYVDLRTQNDVSPSVGSVSDLKSDIIFQEIAKRVQDMPQVAKQVSEIFIWNITKDGKNAATWVMNFKAAPAQIYHGLFDGKSDVQLTISDDDFAAMATGQLNSQQAFLQGKLKIKGNIMLTQKLGKLFNQISKL